jgi:SpoVK/Ycf46/Vps4 family AAA+-type ATPase
MNSNASRLASAKLSTHKAVDALQLSPTARQKLIDFCAQSAKAATVSKLLVLTGPKGTGKTMAPQVLASELGLKLYPVDLSKIVSKYIGETEKNLDKLFADAANLNAVLLFDEADALLGKRTDVKDSHDRYANLEINYLLQKIESYRGLVMITSNRWPPPHLRPLKKTAVVIQT